MSKPSTATAPKKPTGKSAWSKGPSQTAPAPTPRSHSLAPSPPVRATHSRCPSTLGQGVLIKDGVSIPRGKVGAAAVKQGSAVPFGSMDDMLAPKSSSPAATPPITSKGIKSFGTVPAAGHVNGKPSISSRSSTAATPSLSSTPTTSSTASVALSKPAKLDILKMFQNPSSTPSPHPSSDPSSSSMRSASLPPRQPLQQGQSAPAQPLQLSSHRYAPFVPRLQQTSGPGGGPPRSLVYPRQTTNGSGSRSQGGPNSGTPAGRLLPLVYPMPPQMSSQVPHQRPQHHPSPPGSHIPRCPGAGTPTLSCAVPNTPHPPPLSHPQPSMSSASISSPPPTPSTVSMPSSPLNVKNSFVPTRRAKITLRTADGQEVKWEDLRKLNTTPLSAPPAFPPWGFAYREGSPRTPTQSPASIRLETKSQRKKRLAKERKEEREKTRAKVKPEEKARVEKEEAERKVKEEERKRKEKEAERERVRKEEEEDEWLRKEEEQRLKKEEEDRIRKEAEEQEPIRQEEAERKRKEEDTGKERVRLEQERLAAEERRKRDAAEKERRKQDGADKERRQQDGAEKERCQQDETEKERCQQDETEKERRKQDGADKERCQQDEAEKERCQQDEAEKERCQQDEAEKERRKQHGAEKEQEGQEDGELAQEGPVHVVSTTRDEIKEKNKELDLSDANKNVAGAALSAFVTARYIDDLGTVQYPEGISSPKPELNANAKDGQFRYDREFLLQFISICSLKPNMLPPSALGLEPLDQASLQPVIRGVSGRHRQRGSGAVAPSRQVSVGLGFGPSSGFGKPSSTNPFSMGNFTTSGSKLSSDERFANSTSRTAPVNAATGLPFNQPTPTQQTTSQGGTAAPRRDRTRSKRGLQGASHISQGLNL